MKQMVALEVHFDPETEGLPSEWNWSALLDASVRVILVGEAVES